MRVAVIGAGIVGVTTAYELVLQGHEVVVYERHSSVAAEGSFGDAGLLSPGAASPWARPGRMWHQRPAGSPGGRPVSRPPWLWRAWRSTRAPAFSANQQALTELALFSRQRLQQLSSGLRLDYEQANGCLVLLRTAGDLRAAEHSLACWRASGRAPELLDAAAARALEPGLHPGTPLLAAVHWPADGVGNCRQFAQLLRARAQRLGGRFEFQQPIRQLWPDAQPSLELASGERERFDAVVVCAGAGADALLRPRGLKLPLLTVSSHSLTAPLRHVDGEPDPGPRAAVFDDGQQVSITRLGQRLRVSGGGDVPANGRQPDAAAVKRLYRVLDAWFPGAARQGQAQHWRGTRPTLPDGLPVLGASGAAGIWLNLGHAAHGWMLACGAAQVLAEQVSGRAAPLDVSRLGLQRLQRPPREG